MPRTAKQFQEIRESRKKLIMDTALELFANEGYYSTSISRIARKAGISKGLMYNYFESKEDLVRTIMDEGMNVILQTFDPDRDGHLTTDEMEHFIKDIFLQLKENIRFWKLYFALFTQPTVHDLVMKSMAPVIGKSLQMISEYFRSKGAKEPEMEALVFGSLMDGISFNYTINPDLFPIDRLTEFLIERFSYKSK